MIKKINKIKNLGVFSNYIWENGLGEFKKYNLFYGWNGSGKTTLSKLFSSLNTEDNFEFQDLEYEIELENGIKIKQSQQFNTKIRVFNKQYIEDNIEIVSGKAKPIFILGVENKELQKQINKNEDELNLLKREKSKREDEKSRKEAEKGKIFTDVAKLIGANLSGSAIRNYRKNNAESDFKQLQTKQLLTNSELANNQLIQQQKNKGKLQEINFQINLNELYCEIQNICKQTVNTIAIDKLKNNQDIYIWVENGLKLHKRHNSKFCEFCQNEISKTRWDELINFFNDADKELKEKIDIEINKLQDYLNSLNDLNIPNKVELYEDLYDKYVSRLTVFNQEKINLEKEIYFLIEKLKEKKIKTIEEIIFERTLSNSFLDALENLNKIIIEHNDKTDNLQNLIDEAFEKLKKHYLSEIYDEVKNLKEEIQELENEIQIIENGGTIQVKDKEIQTIGIKTLQKKINEAKVKISSEHKAADELNKNLETFLGRKEIEFIVSHSGGYEIKRNGELAKNLSEGEKTAIVFVYFVVHLKDKDFDLQNGIVVIDDPISSLDSNSLFQAFAFLKESVKDLNQVFIMTHNFEFFKLVSNWIKKSKESYSVYHIKNKYINNARVAYITRIDPLIDKYHTEYEYLFNELYKFSQNQDEKNIEDVYHIPNIGRKVLETFLMFRIPSGENEYAKLQKLNFDESKKTSIYKFFNDSSHFTGKGFQPSLVQEAEKNVKYLLQMIEQTFPEHYQILIEYLNSDQ